MKMSFPEVSKRALSMDKLKGLLTCLAVHPEKPILIPDLWEIPNVYEVSPDSMACVEIPFHPKAPLKKGLLALARFGFAFQEELWPTTIVFINLDRPIPMTPIRFEFIPQQAGHQYLFKNENERPTKYTEILNAISNEDALDMLRILNDTEAIRWTDITKEMMELFVLTHVVEEFRRPHLGPLSVENVSLSIREEHGLDTQLQTSMV